MTQTNTPAARQILRQRAMIIFEALKAAAMPETYAEIIRAARALMTVDKMLKQLWPEDEAETATVPAGGAATVTPSQPLNRQQRRAQAAKQKHISPPPFMGEVDLAATAGKDGRGL